MKKVLKILANIAAWLIVIFALLVTILVFSSTNNNGVPQLFGLIPMTVESPSMRPTFEQGDLIITKQIDDPTTLQEGDVISFWTIIDGQKVKNTHRIVRIENNNGVLSFITRGDNNPIDDEMPTYPADIIGKWTGVSMGGAGNIVAFLRTRLGFFICILIPMVLFFLFELYKFIVTVVRVRRPAEAPQLDEEEIKRRAIEEYLAAQKEKEANEKSDEKKSDDTEKSKDEKASEIKDEEKKSDDAEKSKDEKPSDSKDDEKKSDDAEKSKDEKTFDSKDEEKKSDDAEKSKDEKTSDSKDEEKKSDDAEKAEDEKTSEKKETDKKSE
ncbi:MAG: signal peptidase I [Clostridia bacterium]|nr:signal peptidase I [Clostridia bacterium]